MRLLGRHCILLVRTSFRRTLEHAASASALYFAVDSCKLWMVSLWPSCIWAVRSSSLACVLFKSGMDAKSLAPILSMQQQVIERRQNLHSKNLNKMDQPSLEIDNSTSSNETVERTHGMRQMIGEVLQRLNVEELQKLEELLEVGLSRVLNTKEERFLGEISALKLKEAQLMEDNQRLKRMEKQFKIKIDAIQQGLSSESITNICSSSYPPQHQHNEDTCLKLGLPFP